MTTTTLQPRSLSVSRLVNAASAKVTSLTKTLIAALAFVVALSSASPALASCPNVPAGTIALDSSGQAYLVSQPGSYDGQPLQTMWYTWSDGAVTYCAKTSECSSYTESNKVYPGGGGGGGCPTISVWGGGGTVASGSAYWASVTASGGNGSYTYGATGLPSGLSISSTGLISGVVSAGAGTYWVTTTAQASNGCSGSGSITITVTGGYGGCGNSTLDLNVGSGTGTVNQWLNVSTSAWGGCGGYTYTMSGNTPPGMWFSNGGFSGTPTTAGTYDYTITVTDSCGCSTSGAGWITINGGPSCPSWMSVWGGGGNGTVGNAYWAQVTASGGTWPYSYGATGLPAGLNISSSNGWISGTPTTAGTSTVTINATDANGCTATNTVTITITGSCSNMSLSPTTVNGTVNTALYQTLTASGSNATITGITMGTLPSGLWFSTNTPFGGNTSGIIQGTPTTAGTYTVSYWVTDATGCMSDGTITIVIGAGCVTPTITPATAPAATQGTPYSVTFSTQAGYTLMQIGTLPTGLTWNAATGTISGTPTQTGTFPVWIKAVSNTNANCVGQIDINIVVNPCVAPTLAPTTAPAGNVGTAYSVTFTATAGSVITQTGTLPPGLVWNAATATISGTPTTVGSYNIWVTATRNGCSTTRDLTIVINPALCVTPTISPTSAPAATQGTPYSVTFTTQAGYTLMQIGTLPTGLTWNAATGTISGTPTQTGTFPIWIKAVSNTNANCVGQIDINIVVNPCVAPTLAPTTLPAGNVGSAYSVTFTATAGSVITQTGTLPAGLTWNATTKTISGTPTTVGSYNIWVTATRNGCTTTLDLTIVINPALCVTPTISPTSAPAATQGTPYSVTFTTQAGYTLMQIGTLPTGLTWNAATGTISGTPTQTGTFPIWIKAVSNTNANCVGQIDINIVVNPCIAPTLNPATAPAGNVGTPYSVTFTATAGSVITQTGTLPPGLTWNATTATISGTPTTTGSYNIWVTATRNGCSTTRDLTIVINPALCVTPTISPTTAPAATQGTPYSVTFTTQAGYTLMQTGTLPTGLTWNAATGTISGTPTQTGTFPIWIKAVSNTNANCFAQIDINLVVNPCVAPVIAPATLPAGQVGTAYSVTFTATAGSVITQTGTLPAGLTWNAATATISGTPTAAGTSSIWVTATKAGCATTLDLTIVINPAPVTLTLGDCIFIDTNGNGYHDEPTAMANAIVRLYKGDGVTPAVNAAGVLVPAITTGNDGLYNFTGLSAGDYVVCVTPPAGYVPTIGGSDPDDNIVADSNGLPLNGNGASCSLPITLLAGTEPTDDGDGPNSNLTLDFGFIANNCAVSWAQWQQLNPLSGLNGANDNPDYDLYTNLMEYALCGNPKSGLQERGPCLIRNSAGGIDLIYLRGVGGQSDITYTLQGITELANSPTGWTAITAVPTVTNNNNGTETVRFVNINTNALFNSSACGFLRLKVTHTATGNTAISQTHGFCTRTFDPRCTSFSHPFLNCELFAGYVNAIVSGNVLNVANSVPAGQSIKAGIQPGVEYFVEVLAGAAEGQRFEVDEANTTANTIALDLANARSTSSTVPAAVANCPIIVRAHYTLGELMPKTAFQGTNNPSTADRILFFDAAGQAFRTYWLLSSGSIKRWVLAGDATAADRSGRIIDNGEGMFVHPKNTAVTRLYFGAVRQNKFVQPLVLGTNMIGMGYPLELSPVARAQTVANGFVGTNNPSTADKVQFWQQDTTATGTGYDSYFLLSAGTIQQWTKQGDPSLTNHNNTQLYKRLHAGFAKSVTAKPAHTQPVPWLP